MKKQKKKLIGKQKRHWRIRKKVSGTASCPRLTVNRSLNELYVQLIDDEAGVTLFGTSTKSKDFTAKHSGHCGNTEAAKALGKFVAELAKEKNLTKVVFDRAGYRYHGRVKALADASREAGLQF